MKFWKWLDYLYPPRCPVCGEISSDGICPVCTKKLFFVKEHYCMKCGKPLDAAEAEFSPHFKKCGRRGIAGPALACDVCGTGKLAGGLPFALVNELLTCYFFLTMIE